MVELKKDELKCVNGGNSLLGVALKAVPAPLSIVIAAAAWVYDNWDDIKEGWDSYETKYIGK
jgi:hypothetical protein